MPLLPSPFSLLPSPFSLRGAPSYPLRELPFLYVLVPSFGIFCVRLFIFFLRTAFFASCRLSQAIWSVYSQAICNKIVGTNCWNTLLEQLEGGPQFTEALRALQLAYCLADQAIWKLSQAYCRRVEECPLLWGWRHFPFCGTWANLQENYQHKQTNNICV